MFNHLDTICDAMDARRWRLSVALFLAGKACCTEEASTMEHSLEHNFCAHLPDMATHLAPRVSWTGERIAGTITSLASACTASTSARQLTKPLMAKYRIAMHLRHSMNLCQS
jgi:hypothetical protein